MFNGRVGIICLIACAALLLLLGRASAQTWNGLGGNDNWSTSANWNTGVAPVNNGTANIIFGGTTRLTPSADVQWSINSLTFNNTAGLFTITGSALAINGGGVTNNDADMQTIQSSINLNASQTWGAISGPLTFTSLMSINSSNILVFNAATGSSVITGSIVGTGSLSKGGFGTLTIAGGGNNIFSGPLTINAGTVIFNKTAGLRAFGGALIVGDGSGTDIVQYAANTQSNFPSPVINSSGVIDLNGFIDNYASLTINGGSLTIGAGTLSINNTLTMTGGSISSTGAGKLVLASNLSTIASATPASISGTIDMGTANRTFDIAEGAALIDLDVSAAIIAGNFVKANTGLMRLSGSASNTSTFPAQVISGTLELAKTGGADAIAGPLNINGGAVRLQGSNQINDTSAVTVTLGSGTFALNGFDDTVASLAMTGGFVTGPGTLGLIGGLTTNGATTTATISANLNLQATSHTFAIADSAPSIDLEVLGSISNGDVNKTGSGTLRFSGSAPNTHSLTTVNGGMLILAKSAANSAIPGDLAIPIGTVQLQSSNQIADTSHITIGPFGILDLNGQSDTVGPISIAGNSQITTGAGTLTVAGDISSTAALSTEGIIIGNLSLSGMRHISVEDGAASPDLGILGNISGGPLVMDGPGELYLNGNNSAPIILNAGTLSIQSDNALGPSNAALDGGTLHAIGSRNIATSLDFAGPVTIDVENSLTLAGNLNGTSAVTKTGPGSLTLTGAQSISLSLILNSGVLSGANLILAQGGLTMNGGQFSGTLDNRGFFVYNAGTFNGNLINRGTVIINNPAVSFNSLTNFADIFLGNGQSLTIGGLTNNGQMNLAGVNLNLTAPSVNSGGISGFGVIGGASQFINNGVITQGGGNLTFSSSGGQTNNGNIDLAAGRQMTLVGSPLVNQGTINLNGATVANGAALNNAAGGTVAGHGAIFSIFTNAGLVLVSGGTLNISAGFINTGIIAIDGLGSTLLNSGMTNQGTMQGNGSIAAAVTNQGIIEAIGGTLIFSSGGVSNSGTIAASTGNKVLVTTTFPTNAGIINLTGGTFDNNNQALANTGQISGYGTFRAGSFTNNGSMTFSGGTSTINGNVTNNVGHQIRVAYNPAIFTGNVTNNGIFKNTSTTITFAGTYTENGTFISDPADNFFNAVNIGPEGAWIGGKGDRFFVSGDLINSSSARSIWNTADAEIHFIGATLHRLSVGGVDRGNQYEGFQDNFAWGDLYLRSGDSLSLADADGDGGGALYVSALHLDGGLAQIGQIAGNGLNIYYDIRNPANQYLGQQSYALAGGGSIQPVPEPATMTILLMAGALAVNLPKQRKNNAR